MDIDLTVHLGMVAAPLLTRRVRLPAHRVGTTAAYAGTNHILSMDLHFHDYVERQNRSAFPALPATLGFPHSPIITPAASKLPCNGVTGSLGESVAAIVAARLAKVKTVQLVTLEVSGVKTPDFGIAFPFHWLQQHGVATPAGVPMFPQWWPVESKACNQRGKAMDKAAWNGFRQLVSYWKRIHPTSAADAGFGVVCVFKYDNRTNSAPLIRWHVFFPQNQIGIGTELAKPDVVKNAKILFRGVNLIHGV